jgi:hypothetical protein
MGCLIGGDQFSWHRPWLCQFSSRVDSVSALLPIKKNKINIIFIFIYIYIYLTYSNIYIYVSFHQEYINFYQSQILIWPLQLTFQQLNGAPWPLAEPPRTPWGRATIKLRPRRAATTSLRWCWEPRPWPVDSPWVCRWPVGLPIAREVYGDFVENGYVPIWVSLKTWKIGKTHEKTIQSYHHGESSALAFSSGSCHWCTSTTLC